MPKINEILFKSEGFQYAKSLDLNMGYYHIGISKNASNLCMITLPWGGYCYKRLPMVVANSPYIFQQNMNDLSQWIRIYPCYIDDMLVISKINWTDQVQKLELAINGLK